MMRRHSCSLLWLGLVAACQGAPAEPPGANDVPRPAVTARGPASAESRAAAPVANLAHRDTAFRKPAADRVVAIGDLHGDLAATRRALRLAGAIDARDAWIGGRLVLVQTGDQIDRGDDDRAILELFDRLADAAVATGGAVIPLNGNHEVMNVSGDFRYITPGAFTAFADIDTSRVPASVLERVPAEARGRLAAFYPGGPYARRLAERDVVVMVGTTVFVHGGVTMSDVSYGLARLNRDASAWMRGQGTIPEPLAQSEGLIWTRRYSDTAAAPDCEGLQATLTALGAERMVVGHTPHLGGIDSACDGKVWRIDTGIAHYYGGPTQALELAGKAVRVLGSTERVP
jgi:hypothetical protein